MATPLQLLTLVVDKMLRMQIVDSIAVIEWLATPQVVPLYTRQGTLLFDWWELMYSDLPIGGIYPYSDWWDLPIGGIYIMYFGLWYVLSDF